MNITLTPSLERIVREKVASGQYRSVLEVIAEALHLIVVRDDFHGDHQAALRYDIQLGLDQLDRGKVVSTTMEEMMARVEEQLKQPIAPEGEASLETSDIDTLCNEPEPERGAGNDE